MHIFPACKVAGRPRCPNCERLVRRLAQQNTEIGASKAQLAKALARITQLEQQLAAARKEFSTSSEPPIQQVDLAPKVFEVTAHRARPYLHRPIGQMIPAPLQDNVLLAGLVGFRLWALLALQKGACRMTHPVIKTFFTDVIHLPLSPGQLAKIRRARPWHPATCTKAARPLRFSTN